ncbi:MAG: S1C family serine protease [Candidatus Onthomonas sp.]
MYDPDDVRNSKRQERPPWELSTGNRLRDWFPERASAPAGSRSHWEPEQSAGEEQEAGTQPPTPPHDPRGDRYIYDQPGSRQPARKRHGAAAGVVVILAVALVTSLVVTLGFSGWSEEEPEADWEYDWYEEEAPTDPNWEDDYSREEQIPEPQPSQSAETETQPSELERAELDPDLTVEIHSARGLEPLSYQELYAKCLPSTVSITVISDEGIGTGTGIVMTGDGYILTCNHVIEGGRTCRVTTSDDETYEALLVGGDAQTDLAVLKIEAEGLTPAEFGDSDELTVGDEALAIGDPLGTELRGTLTNGIISAINRNVTVNSYSMTLLQTTAALNSGNSGGPLINIYGQVVGVNNMKMNSTVVTVEGLGFAVPTSVVREIVPTLASQGKVSRPVLGITCYGIDQETAERNGEPVTGLRVASVNQGSDAYAQGLETGDYITAVNGISVVSVDEVKEIIQDLSIGDTVEVDVYRINEETGEDETFTLTVALVDQSELN